jgi:RNA polymerase sigma-70 factor (ECF subfamily)
MNRPNDGSNLQNRPHSNLSDGALVSATLSGDKSAYRVLVERYQGRLLRVALDILKNSSDAEDVVQESFVKAFLSLDKFKNQASFYTWLHRITFNMAVDLKRKNQRRGGQHFEYKEEVSVSNSVGSTDIGVTEGANVPFSQNIEGPQEALLRREAGKKIDQVFASLSDEHRAVITLREVDGLDYEEIAAALGVPRGTVMSRLFYARKALQQALREFAPERTGQLVDNDIQDTSNRSGEVKNTKRARG